MKKNLLSISTSLFLTTSSLFAQITTLTSSSFPAPGDNITDIGLDTLAGPVVEGAGQTWNFSTVTVSGSSNTLNYLSPAGTPYVGSFSGATVCLNSAGGTYSYYKTTAADYSFLGVQNPQTVFTYSNPPKFYTLPFTFGSTMSDTDIGTSVTAGNTTNRSGTTTTTGCGSGTLVMPSGSFQNVLQVKIVQHTTDQSAGITGNTDRTSYFWFDAAHKQPILEISTYDQQYIVGGNPQPMAHTKSMRAWVYAVGLKDEPNFISALNVLPNPANNETFVSYNLTAKADVLVTILNTLGQNVKATTFKDSQPGQHKESINIEGLESGLYFINLQYDNYSFTKKLIVN